ncbi:hypothetical protein FZEAL_7334 [Fusarium zealandicum]|uniref:Uncharacterized protein n=1 Tax=Fusarium zealandicum TaxID=1053134 RepID=A0A8H4UH09_9HYPO|nr:hypothetical protein FZEAL_7334 [Fusarium zealandicum]
MVLPTQFSGRCCITVSSQLPDVKPSKGEKGEKGPGRDKLGRGAGLVLFPAAPTRRIDRGNVFEKVKAEVPELVGMGLLKTLLDLPHAYGPGPTKPNCLDSASYNIPVPHEKKKKKKKLERFCQPSNVLIAVSTHCYTTNQQRLLRQSPKAKRQRPSQGDRKATARHPPGRPVDVALMMS